MDPRPRRKRQRKGNSRNMKATCECCGHNPSVVRASLRRTLAACEECGKTMCEECLKGMYVEKGLASEADTVAILERSGAVGLLTRCEESGMDLCPECFEDGAFR